MLGIQEWLCAGMGKVKTVNPVVPLMHKHCCYHGSQLGVLASYSFLFLTMFQQLLFLEITSLTKATSDKGLKMLVALLCGQVIFAIIYIIGFHRILVFRVVVMSQFTFIDDSVKQEHGGLEECWLYLVHLVIVY